MQTFKIGTTNYKWINTLISLFNYNCKEIYLEYGDYLNERCENIYMSWLVHMFANFAINTVGCILFGII